jgi:predicted nucleotidyltransferase
MENSVYKIDDIRTRLTAVLSTNGVKSAVLFGSYAKGCADANSDIDLLVDSGLQGLGFVGLIEYIREALNKDVDVIDVRQVKKGSPVDNEIRETGVRIYG